MDEKYGRKTRISIAKDAKAGRNDDAPASVLNQEEKEFDTANLEPFDSGTGMRKRQPGSISRKILQEEAEEGQPVMRSEPEKSLSPEGRLAKESIFWPGFTEYTEEDVQERRKSATPILKVSKWDTADLHRGENFTYVILATRDFVLYAIYLTTLMMLVFGSHDYAYNFYADVVSDILTKSRFECTFGGLTTVETFDTVNTPQHIWCFLEKVLMPFFYVRNGTSEWVLLENVLVGAPAMIQVRVKNDTCRTAYLFEDLFKTCYDYYNVDIADRDNFGDGSVPFRWSSSALEIEEGSLLQGGEVLGGYQFNFTTEYNFTKFWLEELQNKLWIRQGTRFLVVDFALYTPNTNLFLVVKLDFEVLPAGGVLTNSFFYTWKILRYVRIWDLFVMSCEAINAMFVLYFTFEEGMQIRILGTSEYLKNWWNILDLTIIFLSYMAIITATWRFVWTLQVMTDKINMINTNNHASFNELIGIESWFITVGSILLFFAWIKLFKFTTLFRSITLMFTTIERVVPELMAMFFQAMVISIGFAILGQNLFGEHIVQFSTSTSSFFSMIGIYVGRMHFYRKCLKTYPIIGPLYFGAYIILVCMLHLNAFVGIIVHGYKEANKLLNEEPQRQYMGDLVFNAVIQLLMRLGSDRLLRKLLMKDIIHRRQLDYDEFVLILKRHSIHGLELRMLLVHHELKRGNEMSVDKFLEIYNDVIIRHQLRIESEAHSSALELINKSEQLLSSCNTAILDVQSKVDILIDKLILSDSSKELLKKKKKKEPVRWF